MTKQAADKFFDLELLLEEERNIESKLAENRANIEVARQLIAEDIAAQTARLAELYGPVTAEKTVAWPKRPSLPAGTMATVMKWTFLMLAPLAVMFAIVFISRFKDKKPPTVTPPPVVQRTVEPEPKPAGTAPGSEPRKVVPQQPRRQVTPVRRGLFRQWFSRTKKNVPPGF